MKTFAVKEKRPASAARKAHPYVPHSIGFAQKVQQATMRKILRPDEVQAKQDISENESKYEQETGHAVMDLSVPVISSMPPSGLGGGAPPIQRSENEEPEEELQRQAEEEEEEPIQAKLFRRQMTDTRGIRPSGFGYVGPRVKAQQAEIRRILRPIGAQAKLTIGRPNDKYEQEADRIAEQVMAMPDPTLQRQIEPEEEEEEQVQAKPLAEQITQLIQRQVEEEEEEEPVQPKLVQRQVEEEEEEPVQTKLLQRQAEEEEEPVQAKLIQRQAEEEEEEELVETKIDAGQLSIPSTLSRQLTAAQSGGMPLPENTRTQMESQFGSDFSQVRVHTDNNAIQMSQSLNAQAFTRGSHIFFGSGRYNPDSGSGRRLLAHELTHVVQQGATPQTSSAVAQSKSYSTSIVQRDERPAERGLLGRIWDATGGRLLNASADVVWGLFRERAPQLATLLQDIRRGGILGYLRERIGGAFSRIFNRLRANNKVVAKLFQVFDFVMAQAAVIIEGLRSGRCEPLFEAINRLKQAVSQMAGDAWNAITEFFRPVGDFFTDVWQRFGSPVVEWIQDVAGDVWEFITDLGRRIWDWMEPVRSAFSDAWDWVKRKLGIGQDEGNDQGGLMHWIREKAGEAWSAIRETLEPVMAPIRGVVNRIRAILPLDAIVNLRDTVTGWLSNVSNMTQHMEQENGVVNQQTSLRQDILPGVLRSIRRLRNGIARAGRWVAGHIGNLVDTIQGFFGGLSRSTLLRPVTALLQWVPDRIQQLNQWAQSTVRRLFEFLGNGLVYLSQFIEPVLNTLQKVVEVLGDLMGKISELVFGRFWRVIPRCIRDPIKNFIVERILSNIPIFGQLLRIPNIWERVQDTAMRILRQVFVTGDLAGAAWTFFREVLSLINIPPELVTGIISKAATALGDVLRDPIGFLLNLVRGMVRGILQFCRNIGRHMLSGISDWLFGQLQQAGIQPPADFSLRSILGFVLQILDITRERIFQRMERHPRIGRERVARLRRIIDRLTGVWQWVSVLIREGPAGLWRMLQERLSNLWDTVLNSIITWISTRVISRAMMRLATMADPTGIGAVVNIVITIYQAIQTAAQYARQILEAVNRFLDGINSIARGAIGPAANFMENALVRLLPAAIGFIANWVGLGGLGRRIREMVERIRARVDRAIDWLIERGVRTVDAVLRGVRAVGGLIRRGAQRVVQWWNRRKQFRTPTGERHSLFFRGEGTNARLRIATVESDYTILISGLNIPSSNTSLTLHKNKALRIARQIDSRKAISPSSITTAQAQEIYNFIDDLVPHSVPLMAYAAQLATAGGYIYQGSAFGHGNVGIRSDLKVFQMPAGTELNATQSEQVRQRALETLVPKTDPHYGLTSLGRAEGPFGHVRDVKTGQGRLSLPAVKTLPGGFPAYQPGDERGHLIGDRFYGSNTDSNLVPMHSTLNNSTFKSYENQLATAYLNNKIDGALLYMHVTPSYPDNNSANPASYRPSSISVDCKLVTLEKNGTQLNKMETHFPHSPLSNPNSATSIVNLSTDDVTALVAGLRVERAFAEAVVDNRPYSDFPSIGSKLLEYSRLNPDLIARNISLIEARSRAGIAIYI